MKALILASGVGSRLQPLTSETPKCLIDLGGFNILGRMLAALKEHSVSDIVITTGHLKDKIESFVSRHYSSLNVRFVNNPVYDKTNYIYSMWLAREALKNDDIVFFHGDLLFKPGLLGRVLKTEQSSALVEDNKDVPEKDFKARIENGLITKIGVHFLDKDDRFCAPLYKFKQADFGLWVDNIGRFIKEGKVNCYAEDAFNDLAELTLKPVYFKNESCFEVDDFEDLAKAKKAFRAD